MLGYISATGRGAADHLLAELAQRLAADGVVLAGVVQINRESRPDRHCDMDLQVLGHSHAVRISQDLGPNARGCRLDTQGLVTAVGLVERDVARGADLVIINKFGKSELEGGGFREVIGTALSAGLPVLTAVNSTILPAFLTYAEGLAEEIAPDLPALQRWCAVRVEPRTLRKTLT